MDFVWTSIIHSFDVNHWRCRVLTHHHLSILNDLNSWRDLPAPWRSHGFVWSAESKGQQQTMLNFSRTTMTTMTCLDLDEAFPQKVRLGWPRIGILLSSFVILGHVTQKDRNGTDAATFWHSWCALMTATEALQTNSYGTKPCHNSILNAGRFPAISEVENWNILKLSGSEFNQLLCSLFFTWSRFPAAFDGSRSESAQKSFTFYVHIISIDII